MAHCDSLLCKRIWLQIAMQIIKFRSDFRHKLFNKMMKIVFELEGKEIALKIRAIHCATNCCMNIQDLDVKILSEFLTFECLLNEEFQKDYLLVMILNLLKNEFSKISKFLIEFIINCMVLICFKRFTYLRELNDQSLKDEEKKFLKTVFQFFELYLNYIPLSEKKNSIIKNIVLIYCFFVNYERDYCWKNMKTFLTSESTKIVRFFLEIIYNEVSNVYSLTSFSTLNEYFFYDNDEEFGLTSYFDKYCFFENLYKIFLNKLGTDVNKILIKHKVKIIKGCVCYIGMSIWGYERIDTISIPYNIILSHFLKLINNSHRKIDQEIILCLRRLIKKYGETLTDEWNEIFKIIKSIITRDKSSLISDGNIPITSATQNSLRNLFEILDNIKMLVVCNKFFGKIEDFSQILDEFKSFQNESLILIKSKLKLNNYPNFIANLESVIIEYLLNSKSPRIRNYIIEIIRLNYSYGIKSGKKNIIENLILKHFSSILFSFDNNENLNFFSHLITEMCLLTSEMKFFDQIIRNLMSIHNQYKYLNSDFEKLKMIMNYQKNTLINTYSKLSSTFQSEKMICLNEKIYVFLKNTNKVDFQLLIILLDFFKNFAVNKDYELLLVDNREFYFKNMPSQVVINFKINKDDKKKFIYENLNKNKKLSNTNEIYQPYIVFKHNKLFDYLMNLINHDETHTSICEEVFDFLAIHLRTTFFFKGIKIEKLIQTIVCIDDIKKYATRKKFIDLLIEILVNTTYHLNNNYLMGTSTGNFYSTDGSNFTNQNLISNNQKISSQNCLNNIEITDENLKEKILNFSMSSLKSFINIMKSMVNTYKKQSISMLPNNFINTKQQMDSLSFISSVNINLITEIIDSTSSGKEKEVYITFKMVVNYIKKILNLISIYFSSIPETTEEKLNLFGIKNLNNFYSGNLKDTNLTNNLYINNGMPNKKINEYITCLLDILYDMKNLICFNQSLANSIFYLLLSIKDFLTQSGEENILKIIYLSLNIGWPIYENEILKLFSEYNFKVKKFDLEKVKPAEKYMKREYTNLLADMVCVYFIEKSCHGRVLINIFNSLFKNINSKGSSTFMRENIFLDLSKWQIHSKALRDNTGACNEYRSRIPRNAQIYLGKHSVIMIIPIDKTTAQLIVRNSISNLSITVNNYLDSFNYINDEQEVVDILSSEINISRRESYEMTPNHITRFSRLSNNSLAKEKKLEDSEDYSLRSMKLSFSEKDLREVCRDVKEDNIDSIKRPLIRNLSPEDIKNSKSAQHSPERFDYENKNSVNSLKEIKMINNSNIIMQHLTNLLCEQDFKFQLLEPNTHLEDYIKSLDNTPVYHTFNTGVIYVPSKSNYLKNQNYL